MKIFKYIIYIINIPIFYFSHIIPKNKNVWVFGAWFGNKYADNSKALFEFVNKKDHSIKGVWLSKNKNIIKKLRKKNLNAFYTYSIQGYYYSSIAKFAFVSTGMHDVNRFAISNCIKIQLWHGTPLKKIMLDTRLSKKQNKYSYIKRIFTPFNCTKYNYLISASDNIKPNLTSAFKKIVDNIITTGYPRNDYLFNNKMEKIITVLPTHRGEGNGGISRVFNSFNAQKMNQILKDNSYKLIIKPHFYDLKNINIENTDHIQIASEYTDIYNLLSKTHILITDYSSIYFDFLLLNRPIIFIPFDLKEYLNDDREMYYDYNSVTPGPKCSNWDCVIKELLILFDNNDQYKKERIISNQYFNKYHDSNNTLRLYNYCKNLI